MNVIRLMGGIGNQFFQYAFGRVFQERGVQVAYELNWFGQYLTGPSCTKFPRPYRMDKYNVKLKFSSLIPGNRMIVEQGCDYNDKLFELDNCNFEGYWQHLRYYESLLPALQKELLLKDEIKTPEFLKLAHEIINCESIGLNVRRGDYVGLWPIIPMNYYTDALSRIKGGDLYIFSDDIRWCENAFRNIQGKITFVRMEDYFCLELTRLCKYKICANSTFSWWAAWLGGGTVFCPEGWLGYKQNIGNDQRYPKEWIQLSW